MGGGPAAPARLSLSPSLSRTAPGWMLMTRRLIVAITGASGAAYGVRLLQQLEATPGVETHLMVSASGWLTIDSELDIDRRAVESLASRVHPVRDVGACVASGSFTTEGMIVAPC